MARYRKSLLPSAGYFKQYSVIQIHWSWVIYQWWSTVYDSYYIINSNQTLLHSFKCGPNQIFTPHYETDLFLDDSDTDCCICGNKLETYTGMCLFLFINMMHYTKHCTGSKHIYTVYKYILMCSRSQTVNLALKIENRWNANGLI